MNVLSLFSGIGGLDLGLERAGMTIVAQVEIDPWCRSVLARHWPEVPRHDDVRTAAAWWLAADTEGNGRRTRGPGRPPSGSADRQSHAPAGLAEAARGRPAVDLVAGGFPCQPVFLAGKGLAQADSRWLWPAMAGVIRDLRPRYVLVENVPGLLGRGMGDVLGDLAALGYDAEWDSVPAAFVGAPHIRNRVWIIAYPARQCGADEQARDRREQLVTFAGAGSGANGRHPAARAGQPRGSASILAGTLADADRGRLEECPQLNGDTSQDPADRHPPRQHPHRRGNQVAIADREPLVWTSVTRPQRSPWAAEPGVGRVAHGIPARVDRLRGLGNAVVPQVAEHIGRLIMNAAAPP